MITTENGLPKTKILHLCINILFRLIAIKLTSISKSDCIIQPCTSSLSISITKCLFEFSLRKILGWKYWRKTMIVRPLFVAGIIYFTIILKTNIYHVVINMLNQIWSTLLIGHCLNYTIKFILARQNVCSFKVLYLQCPVCDINFT